MARSIRSQAEDPSVGAVLYQSVALQHLLEAMHADEYPAAVLGARDVYAHYARYLRDLLQGYHTVTGRSLDSVERADLRNLADAVRQLYRRARYLKAGAYGNCPPETSGVVEHLATRYWPATKTRCSRNELLVLVRPRWDYNATYLPLIDELEREALKQTIYFGTYRRARGSHARAGDFLDHIAKDACPKHIALFSVARLDMSDTLMLPLLAHETAHMFDAVSEVMLIYETGVLPEGWHAPRQPALEEVVLAEYEAHLAENAVVRSAKTAMTRNQASDCAETVRECLLEIAADLVAVRTIGVSYFITLAEFLKPSASWPEPFVKLSDGYPGIVYRLRLVWNELNDGHGQTLIDQLADLGTRHEHARVTAEYLAHWEDRLTSDMPTEGGDPGVDEHEMQAYVDRRVTSAIPALRRAVARMMPNPVVLHPKVTDLSDALTRRVVPRVADGSWQPTLADITAAAWMYQLAGGDHREEELSGGDEPAAFYQETCDLVRQALRMLPEVAATCAAAEAHVRTVVPPA